MKPRRVDWFLWAFAIIILSCKQPSEKYNYLLKSSDSNRDELTEIIRFYNSIPPSEGRMMAEFLLDNLPYHATIKYSVIDADGNAIELKKSISADSIRFLLRSEENKLKIDTIPILNLITADHFESHINSFIKLRKKYEWVSKIDIVDFNNYVLPLKIYNEPIADYAKVYQDRYLPYIEDVLVKNVKPEVVLYNYLTPFFEAQNSHNSVVDFTSSTDFKLLRDGVSKHDDIEDLKVLQSHALRSLGVPNSLEFAPVIDNSSKGEIVIVRFDSDLRTFNFDNYSQIYKFRVPKFYRNTFDARIAQNPFFEILKLGIESADIPFSLNIPNSIDVTNERTKVQNIVIDLNGEERTNSVLYLAVNGVDSSKIIAWGKVDPIKKVVRFENIGTEIAYQLTSYKNGITKLIGHEFFLDSLGELKLNLLKDIE